MQGLFLSAIANTQLYFRPKKHNVRYASGNERDIAVNHRYRTVLWRNTAMKRRYSQTLR
jgi:hypothetical protein